MRILLVSLWCHPEPVAKPHDFAAELQRRGHDVRVLTGFPNYPQGELYPGYRLRLRQYEVIAGVNVLRVPHYVNRSRSGVRRIASYTSFSLAAALAGTLLRPKPEVIWTYQIGLPGVFIHLLRGIPLIHEVQDLWPEWSTSGGMGIRATSPAYRLLDAQERFIYRRAQAITTISEGFKRALMAKGVPEDKITVIPNWANERNFRPVEREPEFGAREQLTGKFNVVYGGNIGTAQGLGAVLDAAELLGDLSEVQFVLIGDGVERAKLASEAERRGLSNVRFLGPKPQEEMAPYFAYADVLLIHLLRNPVYDLTIPSKTYAYLASGRPILAAVAGDTADLIARTRAGVACPPGDPSAIAAALRQLYACPEAVRRDMGAAARRAFINEFSRPRLVDQYEALFGKLMHAR